jgi:hypothetical protein
MKLCAEEAKWFLTAKECDEHSIASSRTSLAYFPSCCRTHVFIYSALDTHTKLDTKFPGYIRQTRYFGVPLETASHPYKTQMYPGESTVAKAVV